MRRRSVNRNHTHRLYGMVRFYEHIVFIVGDSASFVIVT